MFANADFKAPGYQIARVHVITAPFVTGLSAGDGTVNLAWTKGSSPYTVQKKAGIADVEWIDATTTIEEMASIPAEAGGAFFRVANQVRLPVTLSGAAERPNPVSTLASGSGILHLDGNKLTVDLSYTGLSGVASAAHLHGPGLPDENAGVLINLQAIHQGPFGTSGRFSGILMLNQSQVASLLDGKTYFNIHTGNQPAGEIRGQVPKAP